MNVTRGKYEPHLVQQGNAILCSWEVDGFNAIVILNNVSTR